MPLFKVSKEWDGSTYGEDVGFVVRAQDAHRARVIAYEATIDLATHMGQREFQTDVVTVTEIPQDGEEEIILIDYIED